MGKKLYVGNIPQECPPDKLQAVFEQCGTVTECDVMGKYAFVHMSTDDEANDAISHLANYNFLGSSLNVKASTGVSGSKGFVNRAGGGGRGGGRWSGGGGGGDAGGKTKLYVGNLPDGCNEEKLLELFEQYGKVEECDVIKNYGFVHMETQAAATVAVSKLDHYELGENNISVRFSTSSVHRAPGVGSKGECFKCGNRGHLSRDCQEAGYRGGGYGGGRSSHNGYAPDPYYDYPPARRPPPADDYYLRRPSEDEYYRRPAREYREYPSREYPPAREYAYGGRPRSRSPPGYRARGPPEGAYDSYERLPARDPYYEGIPPRRSAAPPTRRPLPAQY